MLYFYLTLVEQISGITRKNLNSVDINLGGLNLKLLVKKMDLPLKSAKIN